MTYIPIFRAITIDILPFRITKRYTIKSKDPKADDVVTKFVGKMMMNLLSINIYTQLKYTFLLPLFLYLSTRMLGFHYICVWLYLLGKTEYDNHFVVYASALFPLLYFGISKYVLLTSLLFFMYDVYEYHYHNGIPSRKLYDFFMHRLRIMKSLYKYYDCGLGKQGSGESSEFLYSYHIFFDKEYKLVLLDDNDYDIQELQSLPFPHFLPRYKTGNEDIKYIELYTYTGSSVFVPIYTRSKYIKHKEDIYTIIPNIIENESMYEFKSMDLTIEGEQESALHKLKTKIDEIYMFRYIRYLSSEYLSSKLYLASSFNTINFSYLPTNVQIPHTASVMTSERVSVKTYEENRYKHVQAENEYEIHKRNTENSKKKQTNLLQEQELEFDDF